MDCQRAGSAKANDADGGRGMTAFPGLTDGDIDALVEYLTTLPLDNRTAGRTPRQNGPKPPATP